MPMVDLLQYNYPGPWLHKRSLNPCTFLTIPTHPQQYNMLHKYSESQKNVCVLYSYFLKTTAERRQPTASLVNVNSQTFKMSTTSPNAVFVITCKRVPYFSHGCWQNSNRANFNSVPQVLQSSLFSGARSVL
jgi:hypothetical protein